MKENMISISARLENMNERLSKVAASLDILQPPSLPMSEPEMNSVRNVEQVPDRTTEISGEINPSVQLFAPLVTGEIVYPYSNKLVPLDKLAIPYE